MNKNLIAVLLVGATCAVNGIAVAANTPSLTKEQIEKVEAGNGSRGEKSIYISTCATDLTCKAALMQVWDANGGDVAMSHFLPSPEKVSGLFRGTDMGRHLMEMGALNKCFASDPCSAFLVETTKTLRTLPPEELKQIYEAKAKAEFESAAKNSGAQIQRNLAIAVVKAAENPPTINTPAAAPAPTSENTFANKEASTGEVIDFARDPYSNVIFQLVKLPNGSREIQRRSAEGVKRLASVSGREGKWLIEPDGGAPIEAIDLQLTNRGFVAGTRNRVMAYTEGMGLSPVQWPAGYHSAAVQRGNVAQTGYVLFERDNASGQKSAAGIFDLISDLGNTVGVSKRNNYVLVDLHSGKNYTLNVSTAGKIVTTTTGASNCRKRNALINVCQDVATDSRENLRDNLGMKNLRHYLWSIYWFKAPSGTYLIALEDGGGKVTATKLETGEKRIAFSRALGIADFSAAQIDDGRIQLSARLAFSRLDIEDLETAFAGLPLPESDKKDAQQNAEGKSAG